VPSNPTLAGQLTAVVLDAGLTFWVKSGEVLPLKTPVGLKIALTVWGPAGSVEIVPLAAVPPLTVTGEPELTPSITN
jgi:hypothetical protein